MSDLAQTAGTRTIDHGLSDKRLRKRRMAELRFQAIGIAAICIGLAFLVILLFNIVSRGYTAFQQSEIILTVELDESAIVQPGMPLEMGNYAQLVIGAMAAAVDLDNQPIPLDKILETPRLSDEDLVEELNAQLAAGRIRIPGLSDFGQPIPLGLIADLNRLAAVEDILTADIRRRVDVAALIGLEGEFRGALAGASVDIDGLRDFRFVDPVLIAPYADRFIEARLTDAGERSTVLRAVASALNTAVTETVRDRLRQQTLLLGELETRSAERRVRALLHDFLEGMVSRGAVNQVRQRVLADPDIIGSTIELEVAGSSDLDVMMKGQISRDVPEARRQLNDLQLAWMDELVERDVIDMAFNTTLFTAGASRNPEQSGIGVALVGSFYMMLVVLVLALPLGVATAIYLEEFAPKNRVTDLIEVNINNLAAVPSIVFGLLGLAIFINFMHLPRSAPVVGGLVLTLMTLPTIIIAARAALKAVPPSIREAALGVGASRMQAVFHHVLPLAMPGILTGTIIGMAQALGETAPLLMIGMVGFFVDYPGGPMEPATALPVQVYMWAILPERGFVERTSAAIMVLLGFLVFMNAMAVILRKRFERRW